MFNLSYTELQTLQFIRFYVRFAHHFSLPLYSLYLPKNAHKESYFIR